MKALLVLTCVLTYVLTCLGLSCAGPATTQTKANPTSQSKAAAPTPAPELKWESLTVNEVSLHLPGTAVRRDAALNTSVGDGTTTQALVDVDGCVFGIIITRYPPGGLDDSFPQQVITSAKNTIITGSDATITEEKNNKWTDPNDPSVSLEGRYVVAETANGLLYKSQWYISKDTMYQILQTAPVEKVFPGAFERMVESFRVE